MQECLSYVEQADHHHNCSSFQELCSVLPLLYARQLPTLNYKHPELLIMSSIHRVNSAVQILTKVGIGNHKSMYLASAANSGFN